VSPAVNRVANDTPDVIVPYTEPEEAYVEAPKPRGKKAPVIDDRQASLF
jgi:hypothetical protein